MKKLIGLLLVFLLVFHLNLFQTSIQSKTSYAVNKNEIMKKIIEHFKSQNPQENFELKEKVDSLKLLYEDVDGILLPKDLVKTRNIRSKDDYIRVMIAGVKNPAIKFAKEKGIEVEFGKIVEIDKKREVVNYINQVLKQDHAEITSKLLNLKDVIIEKELFVAVNGIIIKTKVKNLNELYKIFGKNRVAIERFYELDLTYSVPLIGAGEGGVWTDPGVTGDGLYIGVVDTGIDYTHPDLGGGWGNKVVAGYDFGDDDEDPMDCQGHGTHVAGIIAANGQLKGVAPDAKLVAAKIVRACEGSASTLDIAAAFDYMADPENLDNGPEGTHPPVVAVNMSFGSPAGFVSTEFHPHQLSIENCVAAGISVSLSAGNSYWSYYDYGYYPFFTDFSMVGSPSVTPSAISVAASDNSYSMYPALTRISPTPEVNYAYTVGSGSPNPITTLGDNNGEGYEYVFCGLGCSASDFPSEVAGRIALIQRGGCTFLVKIQNAYNAGAIGVIVFNNTTGMLTMSTTGQPPIPAVFISQADGNALKDYAVNQIGGGRVGFRPNVYAPVPQTPDIPTAFSSWGPPVNLALKPEITGPGGGIFSTVPGGGYANYSGTSMSAPHVAAAAALVKQHYPLWTPEQIKTILMNTSKVLMFSTSPPLTYSVLKQGAGRVDIYNALHTYVTVTDETGKYPYVALGDIPNYKTSPIVFNVKLTNFGLNDVTYNISTTTPQSIRRSNLNPVALTGATISTDPSEIITIPAGSSVFVTVTIDATTVSDTFLTNTAFNYIEGFILFKPTGSTGPGGNIPGEIHIPYYGILGNWNQYDPTNVGFNPLMDLPHDLPGGGYSYYLNILNNKNYYGTWPWLYDLITSDYFNYAGRDFYGNFNRNIIAFNPNYFLIEANFWAFRNIQNVKIEIKDNTDNLVNLIDSTDYLYKMVYRWGIGWYSSDPWDGDWWVWDGTNDDGQSVPDGQYKLVMTATPPKIYNKPDFDPPQIIEFPVKLDTQPPLVNITTIVKNPDNTYTITWNPATDPSPASGIWGYAVVINNNYENAVLLPPTQTTYTTQQLPAQTNYFTVIAIDNAFNMGEHTDTFKYQITATVNRPQWGSITPSGTVLVPEYSNQSFTITANPGYHIRDIIVNGSSIFPFGNTSTESITYTYTFTNVTSDQTIQAIFAPGTLSYIITATAGEGGTISPSGDVFVPQFGTQTFTITPNSGYHIKDVLVDGESVGPVSEYTFTNVSDNHTIHAEFEINPIPTIILTYPNGGEQLQAGSTVTITWEVIGDISNISYFVIYPSFDNKMSWEGDLRIYVNDKNARSVNWTVPNRYSGQCYLIIYARTSDAQTLAYDVTDGPFSIVDESHPSPVQLTITSPAQGQVVNAGSTLTINWTLSSVPPTLHHFSLFYSLENGRNGSWKRMGIGYAGPNDRSYDWNIPSDIGSKMVWILVYPMDAQSNLLGNVEPVMFEIRPTTGEFSINVTYPTLNSNLKVGDSVTITWTLNGTIPPQVTKYKVWVSVDGKASYEDFNLVASGNNVTSINWTVPLRISDNCYILVVALDSNDNVLGVGLSDRFNIVP